MDALSLCAVVVFSSDHCTTRPTRLRRARATRNMGTGRTRKRNAHDSRGSSADASPALSAEGSLDVEDAPSRPATLSPEMEIVSIEDFGLWDEAHLKDFVKQVQRHKSLDADKFDAIDGCDGDDVKKLCTKLNKGINNPDLTWLPEVGVKEMIAAVSNELAYTRQQRKETESTLRVYKKLKSEYDNSVASVKSQMLATKRASTQLPKEIDARKVAETAKAEADAKLKSINEELVDVKREWGKALITRHNMKMIELDTRRRLDKIRLKIAATRGEMTCPTVDALERVPPRWMVEKNVCESVTNSKEDGEEDKESTPSSKEADAMSDVKRNLKKKHTDDDGDVEMDSGDVPKEDEDDEEDNEDLATESIEDIGFDEDQMAMEIRLLRNRLEMYNTECRDWTATQQAIAVQISYVKRATLTLQHQLQSIQAVPDLNDRRGGVAASRVGKVRRVGLGLGESPAASPAKRQLPQQQQPPTPPQKRPRKGTPTRNARAVEEVTKSPGTNTAPAQGPATEASGGGGGGGGIVSVGGDK